MNYLLFIILCIIIILYISSIFINNSNIDKNKTTVIENKIKDKIKKTIIENKIKDKITQDIDNLKNKKNRTNIITICIIFIIFLIFIIYYISKFGFINGLWYLFLTWIFFTIATPTPQSGLMVSLPLKIIYGVHMDKSQLIISIFSLIVIFILHYKFQYLLNYGVFGKVINEIIKKNAYLVIFTSIIGSTTISGLFDNLIDIINKKTIQFDKFIFNIILTIISFIYYNKVMKENNLYKILT